MAALFCFGLQGLCPSGFAADPSRLVLENLPDRRVRIVWTNIAQRIVLEESSTLTNPVPWRPSGESVVLDGNVFSSVLSFGGTTRFFRLKDIGPLFTTFRSSPANGETGVAVTRETILTFNQPLAPTTVLTSSNLYAEFGGRRILSRIELSSDRRKATLFYLEDLPASARMHVTFDAFNVMDDFGVLVDADRDEIAGGVRETEFDTLGITPLSGTAVMADAGIACWEAKYKFNFWRPVTAIRRAAEDHNPATTGDPDWQPLLATPAFPEYVSGHSTFSGAAGEVLARYFGRDKIQFSIGSDTLPGVRRQYERVSTVIEEIGRSRILGGIHYPSADKQGQATGRAVGAYVFLHFLGPRVSALNRGTPTQFENLCFDGAADSRASVAELTRSRNGFFDAATFSAGRRNQRSISGTFLPALP